MTIVHLVSFTNPTVMEMCACHYGLFY